MDSYGFVDCVKSEKANAIAKYRRFTNIAKFFQLIEVFVAVALISWSSTRLPFVLKVSGEYALAFSSYLMNQHVVFLLGNVIVVVCYVLSRYTEAGSESGGSGIDYDDGKHDQLNHRKTTVDGVNAKPVLQSPVTAFPITKRSAEAESPDRKIQSEKTDVKTESEVTTVMAIKQAAKQIEKFQRTQTDKLKIQNSMKPRRELRRSVTERSRSGADESAVTSFDAVERLSNEEFRIAVEAFISKQQSFLKQQSLVENCRS